MSFSQSQMAANSHCPPRYKLLSLAFRPPTHGPILASAPLSPLCLLHHPATLGFLLFPKCPSPKPCHLCHFCLDYVISFEPSFSTMISYKKCTHSSSTTSSKYIFWSPPSGYGLFFHLDALVFHSYLCQSTDHIPPCSTALSVVPGPFTRLGAPRRHGHFLTYLN